MSLAVGQLSDSCRAAARMQGVLEPVLEPRLSECRAVLAWPVLDPRTHAGRGQ